MKNSESELKERTYLHHEIWTKVVIDATGKDGRFYKIYAERHQLIKYREFWDPETEWWEEFEMGKEYLDEFFVTGNESGFRFNEWHVDELIGEFKDYSWNGLSDNWSGIEENDPIEEAQKKWENYKNQFPEVNSVEQFDHKIL